MIQWSRVFTALPQELSSIPNVHVGNSQPPGPPAPGDPSPPSDLLEHHQTHGIQTHRYKHFLKSVFKETAEGPSNTEHIQ